MVNTLHRTLAALEGFAGRHADAQVDLRTRLQVMLLAPTGFVVGIGGLVLLPWQGLSVITLSMLVTAVWVFTVALPLSRQSRYANASTVALMLGIITTNMQVWRAGTTDYSLAGLLLIMTVSAWTERTGRVALVSVASLLSALTWPFYPGVSMSPRDVAVGAALLVATGLTSVVGNFTFSRLTEELQRNVEANASLARELSAANEDLEHRVADRTQELQAVLTRQRQLTAEMDELSQRDDLTGLYNRRRLVASLAEPVMRTRAYTLLMADIDRFKSINDTHGHGTGDVVLQRIAGVLSTTVREQDLVARIGGEEFAILLPNTAQADAVALGNRLRDAVRSLRWTKLLNDDVVVTISVGVAGTDVNPETPEHDWEHLLQLADKALYQAKRAGRNRVVAAAALAPDNPAGTARSVEIGRTHVDLRDR